MLLPSLSQVVIGALCTLIPATAASGRSATGSPIGLYEELGPPAFRTPKNILFGVTLGGSSHASWVTRILNELSLRGHNVTYAGTDIYLKHVKGFPQINLVDLGESVESKMDITNMQNPRTWDDRRNEIKVDLENYERIFQPLQEAIATQNIDLVMADSFTTAAFDAAQEANIPSVVTMLINLAPDALTPYINKEIDLGGEPTSEHMSLRFRFYKKFIYPLEVYWNLRTLREQYTQLRASFIGALPKDKWLDSLKIVNSFYGIEEARPMGPLVEMVGPIFNGHYDPLTADIQQFLDARSRVLYVAFGQFAAGETNETERILVELLQILEDGLIDGLLWGVSSSTTRLPETVTTSSGQSYVVADLLSGKHADVRMPAWAPQFPILQHPSVITFLSHGGGMSVFEALFAGTRTVIRPFFGDQPAHALHYEREELGGYLDMDKDDAFNALRRVIQDKDGVYQKNTNRYQAIAQLRAQHAVSRGADLVEEVLFSSKDGVLPHRQDVAGKINFLKANDYDLYMYIATVLGGFGLVVRFLFSKRDSYNKTIAQRNKLKQM
ncbi:hypothetical protein BDB00DRAFT_841429 [Zychaea mexicana]|uniref:uncharacterized protein n=1 Tax=Zychaea mexicana TaxID=64656 RepID=UPI0022FF349F|nr:uncharacterized protein BDB00DRAFT_841429 [Zychaea mexicana]KAI9489792.1 hypothetical protein BDB00DRAFT_841429 [Zychaea mexicana]